MAAARTPSRPGGELKSSCRYGFPARRGHQTASSLRSLFFGPEKRLAPEEQTERKSSGSIRRAGEKASSPTPAGSTSVQSNGFPTEEDSSQSRASYPI